MKNKNGKIGIGITTHNRPEVLLTTLENMKKYLPKNGRIEIVDDGSATPVPEATFRFNKNVGIATAKNKCLELLEDCEHIFLFDDDAYPVAKDWFKPYIESGEPHLMYLFKDFKHRKLNDSVLLYNDGKLKAYSHPRGCMLYIHNSVLKIAGGMDTSYCRWGYEHVDYSNRIHNLGLTTFRFADIVGSENIIHSRDEWQDVQTTVKYEERTKYIKEKAGKFKASFHSKQFMEYKNYTVKKAPGKSVVITTYLNSLPDSQRRDKIWDADYSAVSKLSESTQKLGIELVILNNCFKEKDTKLVKHVHVDQGINPYFQRWLSIWRYLRENPDIHFCFLVDCTDVEMLKNPFPEMEENVIYTGDETDMLGCRWMQMVSKKIALQEFIHLNKSDVLFNCGVVGGSRNIVMDVCRDIYSQHFAGNLEETIDMPIYNFVIHTKYRGNVEHGRKVTSLFKGYEKSTPAWFRHK